MCVRPDQTAWPPRLARLFGGGCYLNNAGIAANRSVTLDSRQWALLTIDFHHGNGTQSLFYDRGDVVMKRAWRSAAPLPLLPRMAHRAWRGRW